MAREKVDILLGNCLHATPVLEGISDSKHADRAGAYMSSLRHQHKLQHHLTGRKLASGHSSLFPSKHMVPKCPSPQTWHCYAAAAKPSWYDPRIYFSSKSTNAAPTLACVTSFTIAYQPTLPPGPCYLPDGSPSSILFPQISNFHQSMTAQEEGPPSAKEPSQYVTHFQCAVFCFIKGLS